MCTTHELRNTKIQKSPKVSFPEVPRYAEVINDTCSEQAES
jgi:hypothetical protein